VYDFWSAFDLDSKRLSLDQQGLQMQTSKEDCMRSRKLLAEQTKAFRKHKDEDKVVQLNSLLRTYQVTAHSIPASLVQLLFVNFEIALAMQEEVDKLTKRSKFADHAFFSLYKSLYEAPDPATALGAAMNTSASTRLTQLQEMNNKLTQDIKEYEEVLSLLGPRPCSCILRRLLPNRRNFRR
jgi:homeobox protein cut-like